MKYNQPTTKLQPTTTNKMSYTYQQFLELKEEDYDKVIELGFEFNQLTELPESIGNCSQLKGKNNNGFTNLLCYKNLLTYLPESLEQLDLELDVELPYMSKPPVMK